MTECVLIVPLRSFDTAKSRLSEVFTVAERAHLARSCAEGVLDRGVGCRRVVVCDDDSVESWARDLDVDCVRVTGNGLNSALFEALPTVRLLHPRADLVIAHGDIVGPVGLDDLLMSPPSNANVVIVPDRRRDGTNVLRLDPRAAETWVFDYGPGSFGRHELAARNHGWTVVVHEDEGLSVDLDTPEDLSHPLVRSFLAAHLPDWTPHESALRQPG